MQDPNPTPWGTQDRFQAHYIVRKNDIDNPLDYTARTILSTNGHFSSKKVSSITWNGGKIADVLNSDKSLAKMIIRQSPNDAIITVEPTNEGIRIYGKWKNSFEFGISQELFQIYEIVAYHLKKFSGLKVTQSSSQKQNNDSIPEEDIPKTTVVSSKIRGTMPKGWKPS